MPCVLVQVQPPLLSPVTPILHLLLLVLATYAISVQVSKFNGPFHLFRKLRNQATGHVKEWLSCPVCFGTTVAALLTTYAALLHWFPVHEAPLWWLAVSGANALVNLLDPV